MQLYIQRSLVPQTFVLLSWVFPLVLAVLLTLLAEFPNFSNISGVLNLSNSASDGRPKQENINSQIKKKKRIQWQRILTHSCLRTHLSISGQETWAIWMYRMGKSCHLDKENHQLVIQTSKTNWRDKWLEKKVSCPESGNHDFTNSNHMIWKLSEISS